MSTNSSTGAFYSSEVCTTAITSVVIAAGSDSASFFYRDTVVGRAEINVAAAGLTSAGQVVRIVTKIAVAPQAVTGLNYVGGSSFSVDINVTDAPIMNSFSVSIQYNPLVLHAVGIDFSSSSRYVLGQSATAYLECIDDRSLIGTVPCTSLDDIGVVTLSATVLGATTGGPTNGVLFSISFNVIKPDYSEIHFLSVSLFGCKSPAPTSCGRIYGPVTSLSFDGYFSAKNCFDGTLCTPPVAKLIYSPSIVLSGKPVFFNATASHATNPGARIISYNYYWGGGEGNQTTRNSTITHVFTLGQEYTLTLVVNDTYGITGYVSLLISVFSVYISVSINSLVIDPSAGVIPGTLVHIEVVAYNHSTVNENVSLHVVLDPGGSRMKNLGDTSHNLTKFGYASVSIPWDTAGYNPRIYAVLARVDPVANQTDTSGLVEIAYAQLVWPSPTGRLSLTVVSGIGVAVALALLFGLGSLGRVFRRKPVDDETV